MDHDHSITTNPHQQPTIVWILTAWISGILLADLLCTAPCPIYLWLSLAATCLIIAATAWLRHAIHRVIWPTILTGTLATGAACYQLNQQNTTHSSIARLAAQGNCLIDVQGTVQSPPQQKLESSGAMRRFMFWRPRTQFILNVNRYYSQQIPHETQAKLTVTLYSSDIYPKWGDRIRCQGWLSSFSPPQNPGNFDYARMMRHKNIAGKLTLKTHGNYQLIQAASNPITTIRQQLAHIAHQSLDANTSNHATQNGTAVMHAMLLGQRTLLSDKLEQAFRDTGLTHLLSVSGLHVGILAIGVWLVIQILTARPQLAAIATIFIVIIYMLIVPPRDPIIRAGITTCAFCLAMTWGRRPNPIAVLAAIAMGILVWNPTQIYNIGFQLSFGIVAAFILFTRRIANWLLSFVSQPTLQSSPMPIRWYMANYIAIALIAFLIAAPIIAYHFGVICPFAAPLALLALPVASVFLWFGFAKIIICAVIPPAAYILGPPLAFLGSTLAQLVQFSSQLPYASVMLPTPSAIWAITSLIIITALFAGAFAKRKRLLAACALSLIIWLMWPSIALHLPNNTALQLHMISVGDGSCYVAHSCGKTLLFDCGSASRANIERNAIRPTLLSLGILNIDTLIISHADIDHFNGSIELVDDFNVKRVITTQYTINDANDKPRSATAFLINQLTQRDIPIELAHRDATWSFGHTTAKILWPPTNTHIDTKNDTSIVLSLQAADQRVLLTGDIQTQAINALLDSKINLSADVTDLPHHGSFINASPAWLNRVQPQIALQSTAAKRLKYDKWPEHLNGITRYITARHGLTTITITNNNHINATTHLNPKKLTNPN